jgi:hypothetical protein
MQDIGAASDVRRLFDQLFWKTPQSGDIANIVGNVIEDHLCACNDPATTTRRLFSGAKRVGEGDACVLCRHQGGLGREYRSDYSLLAESKPDGTARATMLCGR